MSQNSEMDLCFLNSWFHPKVHSITIGEKVNNWVVSFGAVSCEVRLTLNTDFAVRVFVRLGEHEAEDLVREVDVQKLQTLLQVCLQFMVPFQTL